MLLLPIAVALGELNSSALIRGHALTVLLEPQEPLLIKATIMPNAAVDLAPLRRVQFTWWRADLDGSDAVRLTVGADRAEATLHRLAPHSFDEEGRMKRLIKR